MRYIEFTRWRVRLWLADYARRVRDREVQIALRMKVPQGHFARVLDFVSPFDGFTPFGYKNRRLRRLLYIARYPLQQSRLESLRLVERLIYAIVPKPSLGRYEAMNPSVAMKVEWLDSNSEWADQTTGDTGWGTWAALFDGIVPPWSRRPETWLLTIDNHGFVFGESGPDARIDFDDLERAYNFDSEEVEEDEAIFNYATIDPRNGGRLDR